MFELTEAMPFLTFGFKSCLECHLHSRQPDRTKSKEVAPCHIPHPCLAAKGAGKCRLDVCSGTVWIPGNCQLPLPQSGPFLKPCFFWRDEKEKQPGPRQGKGERKDVSGSWEQRSGGSQASRLAEASFMVGEPISRQWDRRPGTPRCGSLSISPGCL